MSTGFNEVKLVRRLMGRLATDSDLLDALTQICVTENIRLGRVEAIGAVRKARIGYYDQGKQEYRFQEINRPLEITKLTGNISVRNDAPAVHAHITLADANGSAIGGHLAPGTILFAGEFILEIYEGPQFPRTHDAPTGLPLWKLT